MTVTSPSARESEKDSPMGGQTEAQSVRALPKLSHLPYWHLGWQTHQGCDPRPLVWGKIQARGDERLTKDFQRVSGSSYKTRVPGSGLPTV